MAIIHKPFRQMANSKRHARDPLSLFDDFFSDTWMTPSGKASTPRVNLTETDSAYQLQAELPGWSEEDFTVTLDNGVLTLEGTVSQEKEEENDNSSYHYREISTSSFRRSFNVGNGIEAEKVNATFDNGILTIEMPKKDVDKPKQIPIGTNKK